MPGRSSKPRAACAAALPAEIRQNGSVPALPEDAVLDAVAVAAIRRHERIWKLRTMDVNCGRRCKQILPRVPFAECSLAPVCRALTFQGPLAATEETLQGHIFW